MLFFSVEFLENLHTALNLDQKHYKLTLKVHYKCPVHYISKSSQAICEEQKENRHGGPVVNLTKKEHHSCVMYNLFRSIWANLSIQDV